MAVAPPVNVMVVVAWLRSELPRVTELLQIGIVLAVPVPDTLPVGLVARAIPVG